MALDTYSDLIATAMDFSEDITEDAPVARLVELAEAELNPILKHYRMESEVTLVSAANAVELPANFMEARRIIIDGVLATPVSAYGASLGANEIGYYQVGKTLKIIPEKDEPRDVKIIYFARLDPLVEGGEANWLLLHFSNIYLHALLVQAARYRDNPRGEATAQAQLDKALALLAEDNRRATMVANPIRFEEGWS